MKCTQTVQSTEGAQWRPVACFKTEKRYSKSKKSGTRTFCACLLS